jgi:hypothetical protein
MTDKIKMIVITVCEVIQNGQYALMRATSTKIKYNVKRKPVSDSPKKTKLPFCCRKPYLRSRSRTAKIAAYPITPSTATGIPYTSE